MGSNLAPTRVRAPGATVFGVGGSPGRNGDVANSMDTTAVALCLKSVDGRVWDFDFGTFAADQRPALRKISFIFNIVF